MARNRRNCKFNRKCPKFVSGFALTQILKLHPWDNSNTLSHSKLAQSLYTYPEAMARNRRTVQFNRKCPKFVSGFALTQILKLHPWDNSNILSHSKLAQSLYTYPEAMARNRRTVNIKETAQCSFRICVNTNPETSSTG